MSSDSGSECGRELGEVDSTRECLHFEQPTLMEMYDFKLRCKENKTSLQAPSESDFVNVIKSLSNIVKLKLVKSEFRGINADLTLDDELYDHGVLPIDSFSEKEIDACSLAAVGLDFVPELSHFCLGWFTEYGCALVCEKISVMPCFRTLFLVVHSERKESSSGIMYSPGSRPLRCGEYPESQISTLMDRIKQIMSTNSGARTPEYVCEVVRNVISWKGGSKKSDHELPKTCISLGSNKCENSSVKSWHLVLSVFAWLLSRPSDILFEKLMLHLDLHALSFKLDQMASEEFQSILRNSDIDQVMCIITSATIRVTSFADRQFDIQAVAAEIWTGRSRLESIVQRLSCAAAKEYDLPGTIEVHRSPVLLPVLRTLDIPKSSVSLDMIRKQAIETLQPFCRFSSITKTFVDVLAWIYHIKAFRETSTMRHESCLAIISSINSFFFGKALLLSTRFAIMNDCEIEALHEIINEYCLVLSEWLGSKESMDSFYVCQRSNEMLVVWIAGAVLHRQAVNAYPLLGSFRIPQCWKDLANLVLDDKAAIDAMHHLAAYMRGFNAKAERPAIFCLSSPGSTFEFAIQFSSGSVDVDKRLAAERTLEVTRKQAHWVLIEGKKTMAQSIRAKLKQLETDLLNAQQEAKLLSAAYEVARQNLQRERQNSATARPTGLFFASPSLSATRNETAARVALEAANQTCQQLREQISTWRAQLAATLKPPAFVVNTLPAEDSQARLVLFFFLMPAKIDFYSRLSVFSQKMLLPRLPWKNHVFNFQDMHNRIATEKFIISWAGHYNAHSHHGRVAAESHLILYPKGYCIPNSFGPNSVDYISDSQQCMWFPAFSPGLAIPGNTNPYLVSQKWTREFYAEKLPVSFRAFQWALDHPDDTGGASVRGNATISQQEQLEGFDKQALITLGTIRSYPNQQVRKVIGCLLDNSLPLDRPVARAVVCQALFHVGELTDETFPATLWKADLFHYGGYSIFRSALLTQADRMRSSPTNSAQLRAMGEVAAFLSQFASCIHVGSVGQSQKDPSRVLCDIAYDWAEDQRSLIVAAAELEPGIKLAARAKECLMLGYSLLCLAWGALSAVDVARMCELIVRFHNGLVYAEDSTSGLQDEIISTRIAVTNVMARRAEELIAITSDCVLTHSLRSVVDWAPLNLAWRNIKEGGGNQSYCFESINKELHFALDLLTGRVLVNGAPLGRLPSQIRNHPLYVRSFGVRDFEVHIKKGVYRTAFPVRHSDGDYFYDFFLSENHLCIREVAKVSGEVSELMDFSGRCTWWPDLPIRLKEMHSHWFRTKGNILSFRPVQYIDRKVQNIAVWKKGYGTCYEVPQHLQESSVEQLLSKHDRLDVFVYIDSSTIVEILAKFEAREFIHTLRTNSGLRFALPRFLLSFHQPAAGCGHIVSQEHRSFKLTLKQQLADMLPKFKQYLVLESMEPGLAGKKFLRLIVPVGSVVHNDQGQVRIELKHGYSSNQKSFVYDEHPRTGLFKATSIPSRLHWASILSAAGMMLPDRRLGITGSAAALLAVEQSWSYSPLSEFDHDKLCEIVAGGCREPSLVVRCAELEVCAGNLGFLHGDSQLKVYRKQLWNSKEVMEAYADERVMASSAADGLPRNPLRRGLIRLLSSDVLCGKRYPCARQRRKECQLILEQCPIVGDFVKEQERKLFNLVTNCSATTNPQYWRFPFSVDTGKTLGKSMMSELEDSWKIYHREPLGRLGDRDTVLKKVTSISRTITKSLQKVSDYLFDSCSPEKLRRICPRFGVLLAADMAPTLTFTDILRISFDHTVLPWINPLLSREGREVLRRAAQTFLALCVLDDRVHRILSLLGNSDASDEELMKELRIQRLWRTEDHPRWLVFEAEGGIQIRPEQYFVVQHMIDNPGAIVQLNMGLGKTRVLLPMLLMHFTEPDRRKQLIQVVVLSALIREAVDFMHANLTASVIGIHICEQPFNREVEVTQDRVAVMRAVSASLVKSGGFQVVAPEHRLSLKLKLQELVFANQTKEASSLRNFFLEQTVINILDESDMLLSHTYQLVYSIGSINPLEAGQARWTVAQAILRVINSSREVALFLENIKAVSSESDLQRCRFKRVFLGEKAVHKKSLNCNFHLEFCCLVLKHLIQSPPYELEWLKILCAKRPDFHVALQNAVVDEYSELGCLSPFGLIPQFMAYITILRGFLGYGLLEHALGQRYRVDYGLVAFRKKRMAVPFRAADVPTQRSEFCHPDVGILLTTLAYYYRGLLREQMAEAVGRLMRLSPQSKNHHYSRWYAQVEGGPERVTGELRSVDSADKIDPTDSFQMDKLFGIYRYSTEAINFWLNSSVFPTDTAQYTQRILASAWDLVELVDGGLTVGFSGTNDNHRLLPLQVHQSHPQVNSLLGTNGMMLNRIINETLYCQVLQQTSAPAGSASDTKRNGKGLALGIKPLDKAKYSSEQCESLVSREQYWRPLLELCAETGANALIDAGALLAGVTNDEAARFLTCILSKQYQGIYYFGSRCDAAGGGRWMVLERTTGVAVASVDSSVRERDAFVLFDDARCRGADMRLPQNAVALLTLGARQCKDKVMQGAGRMRQLGAGQKLILVVPSEIEKAVCGKKEHSQLDVCGVLQWVMANTIAATEAGLPEWARQGLFFHQKLQGRAPDDGAVRDDWSLATLFGKAEQRGTLGQLVQKGAEKLLCGAAATHAQEQICRRVHEFGEDIGIDGTDKGEECEREMQLEEEEVEEEAIEVKKVPRIPLTESTWDYSVAMEAAGPNELAQRVGIQVVEIQCAIEVMFQPAALAWLGWKASCIYGTANFFATATTGPGTVNSLECCKNDILRGPDALLIYPSGKVLMLSDQEADGVLLHAWSAASSRMQGLRAAAGLTSLGLLLNWRNCPAHVVAPAMYLGSPAALTAITEVSLAALQLYSGETAFVVPARRAALETLISNGQGNIRRPEARAAISALVAARGKSMHWDLSDLERLCCRLAI